MCKCENLFIFAFSLLLLKINDSIFIPLQFMLYLKPHGGSYIENQTRTKNIKIAEDRSIRENSHNVKNHSAMQFQEKKIF
jgi:hypothetical protein